MEEKCKKKALLRASAGVPSAPFRYRKGVLSIKVKRT